MVFFTLELAVAAFTTQQVTWADTEYQYGAIRWLSEFGAVLGLALLLIQLAAKRLASGNLLINYHTFCSCIEFDVGEPGISSPDLPVIFLIQVVAWAILIVSNHTPSSHKLYWKKNTIFYLHLP